jgi:hypothetical protein
VTGTSAAGTAASIVAGGAAARANALGTQINASA